jgi:hypothetical protein
VASLCNDRPSQRAQRGGPARRAGLRDVLARGMTAPARRGPTGRGVRGLLCSRSWVCGHPRSSQTVGCRTQASAVMPLDVLGRTVCTLTLLIFSFHKANVIAARYTDRANEFIPCPKGLGNLVKLCRAGDRALQLLLFNEECLVSACHQHALITSLPFVHTARRYYRLNGSVRPSDWLREVGDDHPEPESCTNLVV